MELYRWSILETGLPRSHRIRKVISCAESFLVNAVKLICDTDDLFLFDLIASQLYITVVCGDKEQLLLPASLIIINPHQPAAALRTPYIARRTTPDGSLSMIERFETSIEDPPEKFLYRLNRILMFHDRQAPHLEHDRQAPHLEADFYACGKTSVFEVLAKSAAGAITCLDFIMYLDHDPSIIDTFPEESAINEALNINDGIKPSGDL